MLCNLRSFVTVAAGAALVAGPSAQPASAQGTPWIAEPGTGSINFTYTNQNAKEFWRPVEGDVTKVTGPSGPPTPIWPRTRCGSPPTTP